MANKSKLIFSHNIGFSQRRFSRKYSILTLFQSFIHVFFESHFRGRPTILYEHPVARPDHLRMENVNFDLDGPSRKLLIINSVITANGEERDEENVDERKKRKMCA